MGHLQIVIILEYLKNLLRHLKQMNSKKKKIRKAAGSNRDHQDVESNESLLEEFDSSGKNKSKKSNISKQVDIQMKTLGSAASSGVSKSDTQKIDFEQRLGAKMAFTGIPVCHFKAMLKKEHIVWKRNFKRSMLEIFLPALVCFILGAIRYYIDPTTEPFTKPVDRHQIAISPVPNPLRMGLSNDSRNGLMQTALIIQEQQKPFYYFRNKTMPNDYIANMFGAFLMDNCKRTDYNRARTHWAVIGDPKINDTNGDIISQVTEDIRNYVYLRQNAWNLTHDFLEEYKNITGNTDNPFKSMKQNDFILNEEPLIFKTEEAFMEYISRPEYEEFDWKQRDVKDEKNGICFAVQIHDNIGSQDEVENGPQIDVKIHLEMKDGRTPASGKRAGDNITSQQTVCQSAMPAYDPFTKSPNGRCGEMYFRQGYSYIQNWISNAVLRVLTKNDKASITMATVPMIFKTVEKDDFESVMISIYSYIALIMFILPMYSFILRIQIDKQSGVKRHLAILGLSYNAQSLALFVSYTAQITLITIGMFSSMYLGGMFPKSFHESPFLVFTFSWVQGLSNFGFIIMICSLLPQDMYPKLAAKWGTLIYFGSAFADFTIQKPAVSEFDKVKMSLLFPTLATARASRNLCIYEYTPGGPGLAWDNLWVKYHNYRIGTYYVIMIYALIFHSIIGMLFEKYGSAPEMFRSFYQFFIKDQAKISKLSRNSSTNSKYFEKITDQNLLATTVNEQLCIKDLVKMFKVSKGENKNEDQFMAVDHLSLTLYQNQILALLGHNGAGKTTTVSMLTGMLDATCGQVTCFGKNLINNQMNEQQLRQQIQYIRQIIGICPQHDILFDMLTVREHLDIYCDFKGLRPEEKDLKIDKIMKDVDVWDHRDTMAKSLSGGNKRKLSVAMALVADSKLVLLDEPTSGMDLTARRRLWSMLKDYKQQRIIILTTHNMDEADLLGDRVAIMSQGQLVCLGTSEFLKDKFDKGYKFKVQRLPEYMDFYSVEVFSSKVQSYLTKYLGDDVILDQDSNKGKKDLSLVLNEACYFIPKEYASRFKDLFRELDKNVESLHIQNYSLAVTSLEDVFLRVADEQNQLQIENEDGQNDKDDEAQDQFKVTENISNKIDEFRKNRSFLKVLCSQTKALLVRKIQAYKRSILPTIFEMLVPVILIGIGFSFTKMQFKSDQLAKVMEPLQYPHRQRIVTNKDLVWYHNSTFDSFAKQDGSTVIQDNNGDDDDEDFDEIDSTDVYETNAFDQFGQPIDIPPIKIIENLPNFEDEYYFVDELDVKYAEENVELEFTEEKWKLQIEEMAREERIKQDQLQAEVLKNSGDLDATERKRWEVRRNRTKDDEDYKEMLKQQELQYEENQYAKLLKELNETENLNITDMQSTQDFNKNRMRQELKRINQQIFENTTNQELKQKQQEKGDGPQQNALTVGENATNQELIQNSQEQGEGSLQNSSSVGENVITPQTAKERYIIEMKKLGIEVNTTQMWEDFMKRMNQNVDRQENPDLKDNLQFNAQGNPMYGFDSSLWKYFANYVYDSRAWNEDSYKKENREAQKREIWPYRYGSYYIFEANNKTKNFKVASYINMTSQDAAALWPQFMYEAIIKTAIGDPRLNFKVTNQPFPVLKNPQEREEGAPGIFVCFVAGIGLALIPASIVSRIVHEKEKGLHHMQVVSGAGLIPYWLSFFIFDIFLAYLPCILITWLIEVFDLKYEHVWKALFLYPWAVIPFSYVFSHTFDRESTAQTFTIYLHFLLSGIAGMIIFALRMVEQTALWGDRIMWIFRFICPTFQVCNSIIFASNKGLLSKQRGQIREDIRRRYGSRAVLPQNIFSKSQDSLLPANIGGDLYTLMFHAVFWWLIFIMIERTPKGYFERFYGKKIERKNIENHDPDVLEEEKRVEEKCAKSQICVNSFRKVYSVPFGEPILAVEKASFAVDYGECFALLGVNGAGKSTTFKSLTNVIAPTGGKISVQGKDITSHYFDEVRHRLGYCPQHHALFHGVTVIEHLRFYAHIKGIPYDLHEKMIQAAVRKFRIEKYLDKPAEQLSGGNKRKLQVSIAILGNPQIILLDEPSAGMDPGARKFMWKVVKNITSEQKNTCVVLTTHSMEEAEALCTKMGIMVSGGIFTCFGSTQHIKNKFGKGYEIEIKLRSMDQQQISESLKSFEIDDLNEIRSISSFIKQAIKQKKLSTQQKVDFDEKLTKMIFNKTEISGSKFVKCLNCYLIQNAIISQLKNDFQSVEILESYGHKYFKLRVPKDDQSLGFVFGLVETLKEREQILEYNVTPTSLEMIFQHFAQKGKYLSKEAIEQPTVAIE